MLVREQNFLVLPICCAAQSQDTSTCESILGCLVPKGGFLCFFWRPLSFQERK